MSAAEQYLSIMDIARRIAQTLGVRRFSLPVGRNVGVPAHEDAASDCHCSVLYNSTKFWLGTARSLPSGYNEALNGRYVDCEGGPYAMA
jgi:hypothetical protein